MSKWQEYKNKVGDARPWHMFDPTKHAELPVAEARMQICEQCPRFVHITKQCKECGCFMNLKTKLSGAKCPLDKW